MLHTQKDLNELLIRKEQELKDPHAYQINFLKATLQETESQLQEIHRKFSRLKEDFAYNLKILEERDRELEQYDTLFTQLKILENAKEAEVSDLRIQMDKLQLALTQETQKQEALQYHYQQTLKEHQLDLEKLLSSKDSDISDHRKEFENTKRQLERKLQEVESELALQRQELLVEFDAEMKKREHEFRQKADEMSNLVLSHELKVKLLTKELEALKDAGMKAAESMKMAEAANLELEKEIKCKDWEIKDLAAVKDAKIQDLERRLDSMQLSWKKEKELSERKYAAIDHLTREKDMKLNSMKEVHVEQMHKWENRIQELQINKETLEMELCRAEQRCTDCLREKEAAAEKFEQQLKTLQSNCDSQVAQLLRETVSKDLQIQVLQEEEMKRRAQVTSLLQDIERYKQQLLLASEREEALEKVKVQIELDWQRHSENAERDQYQKSEALIQNLLTARDQVTAELQKKEQKLHEVEIALSSMTLERNQAVEVLKKHGLSPEGTKQVTLTDNVKATEATFLSPEIQRLQEQNSNLRAVIAEMRREMETLNNEECSSDHIRMKTQDTNKTSDTAAVSFTPEEITGASLKKNEAIAPHEDLTGTQVNPTTTKLQDDSVHLKQWSFGKGAGDGLHQHTGNNAQVMQGKLKEAMRKIYNLSKEKQQLLEMVNRLRAELGAVSKEGSQDSKSSQGCVFMDALHPKELTRETKRRLLAVERLQYQLTTQVQVQAEPFVRNDSLELQKNEILIPFCDQQIRKESSSQSQKGQLSSPGMPSSLQDIWQILEMGSNPSILSPQSNNDQDYQGLHGSEKPEDSEEKGRMFSERASFAALTITGNKFNVQPKLKPNKSSYNLSRKLCASQQSTKIRNYNVKD